MSKQGHVPVIVCASQVDHRAAQGSLQIELPVVGKRTSPRCLVNAGCASAPAAPDYLAELGVPRIINGAGVYTMFTGSLMLPECVEAIRQLSTSFVRLNDLHDRVGERIAKLLGSEAAMVSSGAYGAMQLGTAGSGSIFDRSRLM